MAAALRRWKDGMGSWRIESDVDALASAERSAALPETGPRLSSDVTAVNFAEAAVQTPQKQLAMPTASDQFGEFIGGGPKVEEVLPAELHKLLETRRKEVAKTESAGQQPLEPQFVVVDVRSDKEVNVSIIPGAITKVAFERNKSRYKDKLIIPCCTVGSRSGADAKQLAKSGSLFPIIGHPHRNAIGSSDECNQ
ncbi:rhodanese-like domain-containing protein [Roseiconus lacunae]|uniref:Rhodanese-like domain-containing protein n=1 Tax=Roseiconus lacunae TaxID=2605694 RepID=A0ABT7PFG2_9BACT|nr:rhodanese-like domain-containing protein [Roseiconus lacunae]MDM4015235.1 rhodanese-like domain-containing protein [Roseiconus lacunae]